MSKMRRISIFLFVLGFLWSGRCMGQVDDFLEYSAEIDSISLKLAGEPLPKDIAANNIRKVTKKTKHYYYRGKLRIRTPILEFKGYDQTTYYNEAGCITYRKQRFSKTYVCCHYDSLNSLTGYCRPYFSKNDHTACYAKEKYSGYARFTSNYSYTRPYPIVDYYDEIYAIASGTADSFRLHLIDSVYLDEENDLMQLAGDYGYIRLRHDSGYIYYNYRMDSGRMIFNDTMNQYTSYNADSSLRLCNCIHYTFGFFSTGNFYCRYSSIEQHFSPDRRLQHEVIRQKRVQGYNITKLNYDSLGRVCRIMKYIENEKGTTPLGYWQVQYRGSSRLPVSLYNAEGHHMVKSVFRYHTRKKGRP